MNQRPQLRTKKSYTISPESVAFLETLQRQRETSMSAVLEEILQAARREREREADEDAISAFYSSITDEERAEEVEWGNFALGEFLAGSSAE